MKYCVHCDRPVQPVKNFSWGWFWVWTIITIGVCFWAYPLFYFFFKSKQCPICFGRNFKSKAPNVQELKS